ncbi:hypothetical protein [Methyloceanibacter stevinii]|uniref:hypothetical protein n=1 Tax=Methyloceanibacter stevinii TaxID=1774970 RepID=UPI003CC79D16
MVGADGGGGPCRGDLGARAASRVSRPAVQLRPADIRRPDDDAWHPEEVLAWVPYAQS